MLSFAFSTVHPKSHKVYEYLTESMMIHAGIEKENLKTPPPKATLVKEYIDYKLIIFAFRALFFSIFNKKAFSKLTYRGVNVGLYAVSTAYRNERAYTSRLFLIQALTKYSVRCALLASYAEDIRNTIKCAFIDHGVYDNGIFFESFSKVVVTIYHIDYPFGFVAWTSGEEGSYADALQIRRLHECRESIEHGLEMLAEATNANDSIPYLQVDYESKPFNGTFNYVIYTHSFTDGQNLYGYDGAYINLLEWLEDTLTILKGHRICIKAHPGIYTKEYTSQVFSWDLNLFNRVIEKYRDDENITIIDYPLKNSEFLELINPNAIIISHHSNAVLEAGVLGFKCIISKSVNWKHYEIFNEWSTRDSYRKLLNTPHEELNETNRDELGLYYFNLKNGAESYFYPNNWQKRIATYFNVDLDEMIKKPYMIDTMSDENPLDNKFDLSVSISRVKG